MYFQFQMSLPQLIVFLVILIYLTWISQLLLLKLELFLIDRGYVRSKFQSVRLIFNFSSFKSITPQIYSRQFFWFLNIYFFFCKTRLLARRSTTSLEDQTLSTFASHCYGYCSAFCDRLSGVVWWSGGDVTFPMPKKWYSYVIIHFKIMRNFLLYALYIGIY